MVLFMLPASEAAGAPSWEVLRRLVNAAVFGEAACEDGLTGRADSCSRALIRWEIPVETPIFLGNGGTAC